MKVGAIALTLVVVFLSGLAWAGNDDTNQPLREMRLEVDLADGSHVIGIPTIESVPLQTAYASMNVPLKHIMTVKIETDHETATLDLLNGDKLKGVIALKPLELTTVFGPVRIGIEHVREIDVVSSTEGLPAILARGLVLYYTFDRDEGDKVTDRSGKKNDGKVNGAVWRASGKSGGAYSFGTASGYIDSGTSDTLAFFRTDFTIVSWINLSAYNQMANGIIGSAPWAASARGYFFAITGSGNGTPGRLEGKFYAANGGSFVYSSARTVEPGKWYQVAWSWSSRTGHRLYVNGQPRSEAQVDGSSSAPADYTPSVWLGVEWREQSSYNRGLNGLLDEVMLFERALSDAEVKALYNARMPVVRGE